MDEINNIRKLYQLKNVDRFNSVGNRKESSAEHSWSCLVLADYFMSKEDIKLDRMRVYELLMYHDLVEIEAGDTPLHLNGDGKEKNGRELKAFNKLKEEIPASSKDKYSAMFKEFEERKTQEAKFAHAIDKLDAIIHELDHKKDWEGWTEEFLRSKKEKYFKDFPGIMAMFERIVDYCLEEEYFPKR